MVDNYFRVIRRDGTGGRFSLLEDTFAFDSNDPRSVATAWASARRQRERVDAVSVAVAKAIPLHISGEWSVPGEWREREDEEAVDEDGTFKVDRGYWTGVPLIGQSPPKDMRPPSNQQSIPGVE